ncbi:nucleotide disphospho-sugar-binding domain-containing protein [Dactylosporangium sp. NPDC005572]|uniref:nucleotide disphospho-sugar-binding domain-containing protein n=1 Tax=Dactylosporangium sp. NPDC005572 TaxID=3156889 RepID=UPI0033AE12D6
MRVLLVAAPLLGHVFPLVPLGRALRDAGHEVLVATGGDAVKVAGSGLPVEDVAPGFAMGRVALPVMLRHPLIARAELAGRAGTRGVRLLFGAVHDRIAGPVTALAERWRPDLVVHEPLAPAGTLAARRTGARAVLHENTLFDARTLHALFPGVPQPDAVVSSAPPSVLPERTGWPMRPVPYGGEVALDPSLAAPERPWVVVSRSTIAGGPVRDTLMDQVVAAAPAVDADFLLVRPPREYRLPPNVRTTGWAPIPALLEHAAAIVHHGGAGTVLAALAAGVPQLVLNGAGDRRHNASLVAGRGAGLAADAVEPAVLRELLAGDHLRTAAREVAAEIAAMPSPAGVVPRLEGLA